MTCVRGGVTLICVSIIKDKKVYSVTETKTLKITDCIIQYILQNYVFIVELFYQLFSHSQPSPEIQQNKQTTKILPLPTSAVCLASSSVSGSPLGTGSVPASGAEASGSPAASSSGAASSTQKKESNRIIKIQLETNKGLWCTDVCVSLSLSKEERKQPWQHKIYLSVSRCFS